MSPEDLRQISAVRALAASGEARVLREELRLTLREVAAVVGSSPSTVYRWERSVSAPRRENALRWAAALGIRSAA